MNIRTPFGHATMTGRGHGAGTVIAIVLFAILLVAFSLAWIGLSIWALVFGIVDLNNVGVNFWNIFWIVLGAVGLLIGLFGNRK